MKIKIGTREFSVDDEVITKAVEEKADVTIEAADLVIRDKTEEESFINNLKSEAKTAGIEMAVKEARNNMGLDFQGKTIDNLVEAVKTKTLADAKIEPAEKVRELEADIATLKSTLTTTASEKEQIQANFKAFKNESVISTAIASAIPDNATLPKDDMVLLIKSKMQFQVNDNGGVNVLGADGQIMKNTTTLDPLDAKTVVTSFFNDNPVYVKGAKGGAGGDDSIDGSGKMTVDQFVEKKAKEGVSHTSEEFNKELQELIKQDLIITK